MLSRYDIQNYAPNDAPMAKDNKFDLDQCPKLELEKEKKNGEVPLCFENGEPQVRSSLYAS